MRRKKILIKPILRNRKNDLSKKWYVELSQRNPKNDKMQRCRYETYNGININSLTTIEERYKLSQLIIKELNDKIASGWTIFNDTESVIYEDQTQYSYEAKIFKKRVESNKTVNYWLSRYIVEELNFCGLRNETISTYKSRCRVFRQWLDFNNLGKLDITSINNDIIIKFCLYLRNERSLAKRTYNSYIEILISFFEYVIKHGGRADNPVHSLPENKLIKDCGAERIQYADLKLIFNELDKIDRQLALACRFEFYCALRPGYELRLLKICDIDFKNSRVRVQATNAKIKRRRIVIIPDDFLNYLINEWKLNTYSPDYYVIGKNYLPGLIHLGKNNMRYRFNKIRKKLGLPREYKFYSFKHTGATMLAEQGEPIINIRDHLGHTSIATTEHYLNRHGVTNSTTILHNFPKI